MSSRREVITLLGGAAAAWPLAARAQQQDRGRRVAVFEGYAQHDPEGEARMRAFAEGLQELGWRNGRNLTIDYHFDAANPKSLEANAAALALHKADVIVTTTTPITQTVLRYSKSTPIVFVNLSDPIGSGLVMSFAKPGSNITGFTNYEASLAGKWLELITEVDRRVTKVTVISNANNPTAAMFFGSIEAAGASIGVQAALFGIRDPSDINLAIDSSRHESSAGLIVLPEPVTGTHRTLIIALAARYRMPAIYPYRFFARDGGLLAYGVKQTDLYRRAASYVDRILKGEKPGELPVQQPTKFELIINLKTARALGLIVPPTLLATADEVIE
jgi:putative tryptophan/tyrosine transport system substrate-binding protein